MILGGPLISPTLCSFKLRRSLQDHLGKNGIQDKILVQCHFLYTISMLCSLGRSTSSSLLIFLISILTFLLFLCSFYVILVLFSGFKVLFPFPSGFLSSSITFIHSSVFVVWQISCKIFKKQIGSMYVNYQSSIKQLYRKVKTKAKRLDTYNNR